MAINTNFWKNKNVFVTGHTGFKGSWLSIWLEYMGANVTGYSLKPKSSSCLFYKSDIGNKITSIYGDILNYKKLFKSIDHAKPEIFFHLAAQPLVSIGYKNPLKTSSDSGLFYLTPEKYIKDVFFKDRKWPLGKKVFVMFYEFLFYQIQ